MANTDLVNEGLLGAYHDELMKTHLAGGVVFDISAYNLTNGQPTPYADLAAALGTNGANIPEPLRKGGMSVKFVQSSDNNYVQFRCMTQNFTTDVTQWQGVDNVPTAGSNNLAKSSGIAFCFRNREISFEDGEIGVLKPDGTINNLSVYNTTDYIPVQEGQVFLYKGYTASPNSQSVCCGYDSNKENSIVIVPAQARQTKELEFSIPANISYIRVSAANNTQASYNGRYLYRKDLAYINKFKSGESVEELNVASSFGINNGLTKNSIVAKLTLNSIPQIKGFALNTDGTLTSQAQYSVTDFIEINDVKVVHYTGKSSSSYTAILGYDVNKENPTVVLAYSTVQRDIDVVVPDGIKYVRMSAVNENYSTYESLLFGVYENKLVSEALNEKIDALTPKLGETILFNNQGQLKIDGTVVSTLTTFNTSDFIPVNKGDTILYRGYTGGSSTYAPIVGYDSNKSNPVVLQETKRNVPIEIIIPDNISFIRVSAANSGHSDYKGRYCKIIPVYYRYFEPEPSDVDLDTKTTYHLPSASTSAFNMWCGPVKMAGLYKVYSSTALTEVKIYDGFGTTSTLIRTLSGTDITSLGNNLYSFNVTETDIESGALYFRLDGVSVYKFDCFIEYTYNKFDQIYPKVNPLKGKKVAVIGDSISSSAGWNTPYFTIQACDVGNQIQSYISYIDVYGTVTDNPTPLGTTIGGVTLTAEMIGTLQTFTPVSEDIGKKLGQAKYYNGVGVYVWCKKMCDELDAIPLANASWSGASMCSGQGGILEFSHAFSPMTIGRCRVRDEEGNYINPDVIIIYRGINDLSHIQGSGDGATYSVLDDYDIDANGYPVTDINNDGKYSFRRAYYMTIKALRDAYPSAIIYCATLNVFKRVIYDRFPTRNGLYSLPDMNNVIRDIANEMGCGLIEFDKDGITFENCYSEGYITDSATIPTHPNSKGHAAMAKKAIADLNYTL